MPLRRHATAELFRRVVEIIKQILSLPDQSIPNRSSGNRVGLHFGLRLAG